MAWVQVITAMMAQLTENVHHRWDDALDPGVGAHIINDLQHITVKIALLATALTVAVVDYFIIRRVWRAVHLSLPSPPTAGPASPQVAPPNSMLSHAAYGCAWASGIFAALTWSMMPQPPEFLVWSILIAALLAVALAAPVRKSPHGKWALWFGSIQSFVWVLIWMFFAVVDGAKGVLQILGTSDAPSGLKIRYKLVQMAAGSAPSPSITTAATARPATATASLVPQSAVESAREALAVARTRFNVGAEDRVAVIEAEEHLRWAEAMFAGDRLAAAQAKRNGASERLQLMKKMQEVGSVSAEEVAAVERELAEAQAALAEAEEHFSAASPPPSPPADPLSEADRRALVKQYEKTLDDLWEAQNESALALEQPGGTPEERLQRDDAFRAKIAALEKRRVELRGQIEQMIKQDR
jgi:hypothetical protein